MKPQCSLFSERESQQTEGYQVGSLFGRGGIRTGDLQVEIPQRWPLGTQAEPIRTGPVTGVLKVIRHVMPWAIVTNLLAIMCS